MTMTIEEKAKAYDKALGRMKSWVRGEHPECFTEAQKAAEFIFPELKESEDEKIRKVLIELVKCNERSGYTLLNNISTRSMLAWLEKQGEPYIKWNKNTEGNKPQVNHSVLMKTTHGIAEGEWKGEYWRQYRWAGTVRDSDVLSWVELSNLEKQGEQKPFDYEDANIQQKDFAPKSAMEAAKEKKIDDANKIEHKDYNSIDPHFFKTTDKVEPKFKVGDWITDGYLHCKITDVLDDRYIVDTKFGKRSAIPFKRENNYHLWTIADAKDGDVLVINNDIFIYAHRKQMYSIAVAHCFVNSAGGFYLDGEFGYTENGNSIHPATKEQRDTLEKAMTDAGYIFDFVSKELKKLSQSEVTKMSVQEEIAEIPFGAKDSELQEATYYISKGFHAEIDDDKVVIKKGEKPTAWTEEDNMMIEETLYFLREYQHSNRCKDESDMQNSVTCREWLKSLKQRIGG